MVQRGSNSADVDHSENSKCESTSLPIGPGVAGAGREINLPITMLAAGFTS